MLNSHEVGSDWYQIDTNQVKLKTHANKPGKGIQGKAKKCYYWECNAFGKWGLDEWDWLEIF